MKEMKWIVLSTCLLFTMFIGQVNCSSCKKHEFGRDCTYLCHCRNDDCDKRGMCMPPGDCEDGWGGRHCSYRDEAFHKMNPLTDNNSTTCLESFFKKVYRFTMREETKLTLISFKLKKKNVFDDATISFEDSSHKTVIPTYLRKIVHGYIVDGFTVDLIGSLDKKFKYIKLVFKTWTNIQNFCGMFVSGGRNVAFKQPVSLSTVWGGHDADRAVDGVRDSNPLNGHCINSGPESTASLNVWPRLPIDVNVIEIYNRDVLPCKLKHFRLWLFTEVDSWDTQAQIHVDKGDKAQMNYTVYGTTFEPIRWIWLGVSKDYWGDEQPNECQDPYQNSLTVCELEVYGEVMCIVGQYGYDCEKRCNSNCVWGCHVETGYCNICPAGRSGKYCEIIETTESPEPSPANAPDKVRACEPGVFGLNCTNQCHCRSGDCTALGECADGCEDGWGGIHCSYRDAAFNTSSPLTDNSLETCLDSTNRRRYRFKMREDTKLTWIRFNLKQQDVFEKNVNILFRDSRKRVKPTFLRKIVDGSTVDFIGSMRRKFKYIILRFKRRSRRNKQYFCGMFVSGGRNMAFKQPVTTTSVWEDHVAERAVDGVRDANLDNGHCASTQDGDNPWLNLVPRIPIDVNFVEIYNSDFLQCRLRYFTLLLFLGPELDWRTIAQKHQDEGGQPQMVYKVLANTFKPIRIIYLNVFRAHNKEYQASYRYCDKIPYYNVLTVCELEVYGEAVCTVGQYGYDCEMRCHSNCVSGCHVETGYCNKCVAGRSGKHCEIND